MLEHTTPRRLSAHLCSLQAPAAASNVQTASSTCSAQRQMLKTNSSKLQVIHYKPSHWIATTEFISRAWISHNHPLCDRQLFEWQYRVHSDHRREPPGENEAARALLLVSEDGSKSLRTHGFFGCTQVALRTGPDCVLNSCGEVSMWFIDPKLECIGAGLLLFQRALEEANALVGFNLNDTSRALYSAHGAVFMQEVPRFFAVLDERGIDILCSDGTHPPDIDTAEVFAFQEQSCSLSSTTEGEIPLCWNDSTCSKLGAHWLRCAAPHCGVAIERDASFWKWRYSSVPGTFEYRVFGDDLRGYVVARVEMIGGETSEQRAEGRDHVHGPSHGSALRIVECLPSSARAWRGGCDKDFAALLRGVCVWAMCEHGVCVADFWCSSTRFYRTMRVAGFHRQTPALGVPMIFASKSLRRSPLNACVLLKDNEARANFDWEHTYFTKTTGDSDRPTLQIGVL